MPLSPHAPKVPRYLESVMTTLRIHFGKYVANVADADDDEDDDDDDDDVFGDRGGGRPTARERAAAKERALADGHRRLKALATKLAHTLGVGALAQRDSAGSDAQACLEKFTAEGVRFALERAPRQLGFFDAMTPFLRLCSKRTKGRVQDHFETRHADEFDARFGGGDDDDEADDVDAELTEAGAALAEFDARRQRAKSARGGGGRAGGGGGADDDDDALLDDDDDDDDEAARAEPAAWRAYFAFRENLLGPKRGYAASARARELAHARRRARGVLRPVVHSAGRAHSSSTIQ